MAARFKVGNHVTYTDHIGGNYHGIITSMDCKRHPDYPIEVTFENRSSTELFTLEGRYHTLGNVDVRIKLRDTL